MSLGKEEIIAIVAYRKEKAYATLKEVEDMIDTEHWNLAVQRLYYACFYMASALLMSYGFNARTFDFASEDVVPLLEPTRNLLTKIDGLIVF